MYTRRWNVGHCGAPLGPKACANQLAPLGPKMQFNFFLTNK